MTDKLTRIPLERADAYVFYNGDMAFNKGADEQYAHSQKEFGIIITNMLKRQREKRAKLRDYFLKKIERLLEEALKERGATLEEERRAIGKLLERQSKLEECDPDTEPYYLGYYWIDADIFRRIVEAFKKGEFPKGIEE